MVEKTSDGGSGKRGGSTSPRPLDQSQEEPLADDHPARIVDNLINSLDLSAIYTADEDERGQHQPRHDVRMMTKLLFYASVVRLRSWADIERAMHGDAGFRFLAQNHLPDRLAVDAFRTRHATLLGALFARVSGPFREAVTHARRREERRQSVLRHGREAAAVTPGNADGSDILDRLAGQLQEEDEGPLPEEARTEILQIPTLFEVAGGRALPLYGRSLLKDLAPLLVLHALWAWRTNYGAPGTMQACHLVDRIGAFADERHARRRPRRSSKNLAPDPRAPTGAEFSAAFGSDAPVVEALWPCVRFLVALRGARSFEEEYAFLWEVGYLLRLFASVHIPARNAPTMKLRAIVDGLPDQEPDKELETAISGFLKTFATDGLAASVRCELERALSGRAAKIAGKRLGTQSMLELLEYVWRLRDRILRAYTPEGRPRRARAYLVRAVHNDIGNRPVEISRAIEHVDVEGEQGVVSRELAPIGGGVHQTKRLVPASSYRKRRRMDPREIPDDIERGRQRQRHRVPGSEWLTAGQCAEIIIDTLGFQVSRRTVLSEVNKAVGSPGFLTRTRKLGSGWIHQSSLRALEGRLAARFRRRPD